MRAHTTITHYSKSEKDSDEEMPNFNEVPPHDAKNVENATTTSNRDDKKSNAKKPLDIDNKASVITVAVLKLGHYCQGCGLKIHKIRAETDGVQHMALDEQKEMVTVKGTMDAKLLMENLRKKLNIPIDIVSLANKDYSNNNGEDSENVSSEKDSSQENESKSNDAEVKQSTVELKPHEAPVTMAVFKVPLHCDGCIKKIKKIISRIRGVDDVIIDKEEETVTVIGRIVVNSLFETMKERLKKLVDEQNIKIKEGTQVTKAASQYIIVEKSPKQQSYSQPALEISVQQSEISLHRFLSDEGSIQNQSSVSSSGYAHPIIDSEIRESSSTSETTAWAFLISSLVLEGVSAVLDQLGYLLAGMVLAFVALFFCTIELVEMARHEEIAFDRSTDLPRFHCHSTNKSPTSEHFSIVHCFGLTCAIWQCLYSTMQYIYALRHLDNPIKTTLLPFLFLLCVLISKLVRKTEENNCENLNSARDRTISSSSLNGQFGSGDQGYGSGRSIQQNGHTSESMEIKEHVQTASAPADTTASTLEFASEDFGCSHYRRRCKIRAPCCNEIFFCENCHNEAKNTVETSAQDRQCVPLHGITRVICAACEVEQDVQQNCITCGLCMGKYFCPKCKFLDDDNQYHCDECGICRNGGREGFFHCKTCGSCYPNPPEEHRCVEKEISQD